MPDFFEVLQSRRTVRSYREEPVSDDDLKELIECAILAPTGVGSQPWAFTVVTNRQVMERLSARIKEVLIAANPPWFQGGMRDAVTDPAYDIFYHAPALIAISGNTQAPTPQIDCQLATENLFLAAHAKGLGTCYMGFLLFGADDPEVRSLLRMPEGYALMAATTVGHPASKPEGPPKRNPPKIEWVR
jgi:nitroreductase